MVLKEGLQPETAVTNNSQSSGIKWGYIRTYEIAPDLLEAYYKAAEVSGFGVTHIANPGEFILQQTGRTRLTAIFDFDSHKAENSQRVPKLKRAIVMVPHIISDGNIGISVRKPYRKGFDTFEEALKAEINPPVHSAQRIQR